MQTEYNLKACPFCGQTRPVTLTVEEIYGVETGRNSVVCLEVFGGCGASGGNAYDREEAAGKWNQRCKENRLCSIAPCPLEGKCVGYQRSYTDDEPIDMCKECPKNQFYEAKNTEEDEE